MTHATFSPVQPVTLEGPAVRLEPLSLVHVPALAAAAAEDRATYAWTHVPHGEAETRAYVEAALELAGRGEALPFATRDLVSGRVVGSTRFANFERLPWDGTPASPAARPDAVEIGWTWLAASAQRSAINTGAKFLMLRHAFEVWGTRVVRLKTDRRNARSRAAIERIGAKLDGVIRAHSLGADGQLRDSAYYSIIETEWPAVRAALEARPGRG
ncbi:MAG: N-acetyltransferase [Dehalococcoidia bacterium]